MPPKRLLLVPDARADDPAYDDDVGDDDDVEDSDDGAEVRSSDDGATANTDDGLLDAAPTDGPGVTAELVSEWKSVNFDDSGWEIGSERAGWGSAGTGTIEDAVVDAIVGKMMWTSDYDGHNDVFCRIVHDHKPPNCKDAADRYAQDYPEIMQQREAATLSPFAHFNQFGRAEGRIW